MSVSTTLKATNIKIPIVSSTPVPIADALNSEQCLFLQPRQIGLHFRRQFTTFGFRKPEIYRPIDCCDLINNNPHLIQNNSMPARAKIAERRFHKQADDGPECPSCGNSHDVVTPYKTEPCGCKGHRCEELRI